MPTIDERVVAMSFENKVFETRAAQTMVTLSKLDVSIKAIGNAKGLENIEKSASKVTLQGPMSALEKLKSKLSGAGSGAAQGLGEIDRAGNKVSLEGPARAIDKLQSKFGQLSAGTTFTDIERASDRVTLDGLNRALNLAGSGFGRLEQVATIAFGNITAQATMKGAAFAKSFAIGPITDGFKEYQTNLGSIQTILSNTRDSGGNLESVNAALQELNTYSDKTIYNFSEMARNIGTFTAAGVQLKPATSAIKGIANLAALSGSNSQQASTAMYQLSQAIAAGKVGLQDWNSVVNAGMGGAVFQKALMRTAENMGALKKGAVEIDKATGKATVNGNSFRESIMAKPGRESWLTSDVLTNTLSQFTGDMSDAQLAAKGFNAEQIKAIQGQAKAAQDAATQVKTLPQVFDVAKETIGSGWSQTFQTLFGDFAESKKTFTDMSNFINGFINKSSAARNKMLAEWKTLGGRDDLLAGIKASFKAFTSLIAPVKDAFREVFPATTGKQLAEMTKNFRDFAESLKIDPQTADNIKRTFAGIFAVFDIAKRIIGGVVGVVLDLIGAVGKGSGGFLSFTGGIGDFLVALDNAIAKGDAFKAFFDGVSAVLKVPLQLIVAIAKAIANMFGGDKGDAAAGLNQSLDAVNSKLGPLKTVIDVVVKLWDKLVNVLGKAKTALEPWFDAMVAKLQNFGQIIGDAFQNMNFDQVMSAIQTGLVGGIFLTLKKGLGGGLSVFGDAFEGVNGLLKGLTGNLEAMQKNVQAKTLLSIGAAILVLAGGVKILSTINGKDLSKAMAAVAVGLGELMGAMKLMTTGLGKTAALQLPLIAAGLIGMSVAVTILAGAMKIFATMKWEDIGKGLAGVGGALAAVGLAMNLMPPTMPLTAAGLILVGVALNIIAVAMKAFGQMKWEEMAKGLFGVVEALGGIALGVSMLPPTLPLTAAGLILMGIALASIGGAIKVMGALDLLTIVKGLGAMMAAIAGIGLAVSLIPPTIALSAAGLLIVGGAMVVVAKAIGILGSLSVGKLVKGLVGLAGALIILAGGLTLMIATLPGSVALLAAAAALAVLVPVLGVLGTMDWGTIFKGLAAMALVLVTIGVAGLVAAPALAAIGIALIPLGAGFLLVASAAKIFAAAMALLGSEGQKGVTVFLTAFTAFVALLPTIILNFIKGIVDIAGQVAALAPKIVIALGVIIDTVLAFIIASAPKLAQAIGVLVEQIVRVLATNAPKLIASGVQLLTNLLNGLSQNIGQVTSKVADIVVKFLEALRSRTPDLVNAGANLLKAFLDGVGSKFGEIATSVGNLISKFSAAVGSQAGKIVTAAATMMGKFVGALATFGPQLVAKGAEIITKFLEGMGTKGPELIKRGVAVAGKLLKGIADGLVGLADMGLKAIIGFLNGLEAAIRENTDPLINAGLGVGDAIMDGIVKAFGKGGFAVRKALEAVFTLMPGWAKKVLGIKSPSKVFADIGMFTMLGFKKGIDDNAHVAEGAAEQIGGGLIASFRKVLGIHSPSEVFRDLGMQVNRGFKEGLEGSADDVKSAFQSLNEQLINNIRSQKSEIEDGNQKIQDLQQQHADKLAEIAKLQGEKKPDKSAIADALKAAGDLQNQINAESHAVAVNEGILAKNRDIRALLTKGMSAEKTQLLGLKKTYEDITKQLEDAQQALDEAARAREDARAGYVNQYTAKPDADSLVDKAVADAALTQQERQDKAKQDAADAEKRRQIDQVALYKQALADQLKAQQQYQATLQKLRDAGLDDETYKQLLAKGTAGQEFADQLLKSGAKGIAEINKLNADILAQATDLAKQATDNLYKAGVDAAQGLVDGLNAKKGELEKQMQGLADAMVNQIKAKLKIKSPSRVLMEVGKYAAQGVAEGLKGSTQTVTDAATGLGDSTVSAMASSLAHISDAVGSEIDPDLTITPVLDLTKVRKSAGELASLTNVTPITAAASYGQASAASQEVSAAQRAASEAAAAASGPSFVFEQNNTSPKALDDIEIYRQTRNQLGQVKKVLGLTG